MQLRKPKDKYKKKTPLQTELVLQLAHFWQMQQYPPVYGALHLCCVYLRQHVCRLIVVSHAFKNIIISAPFVAGIQLFAELVVGHLAITVHVYLSHQR